MIWWCDMMYGMMICDDGDGMIWWCDDVYCMIFSVMYDMMICDNELWWMMYDV